MRIHSIVQCMYDDSITAVRSAVGVTEVGGVRGECWTAPCKDRR